MPEEYRELNLQLREKGTIYEELTWTDKFIVNYQPFFRIMLAASVLGLVLLMLV